MAESGLEPNLPVLWSWADLHKALLAGSANTSVVAETVAQIVASGGGVCGVQFDSRKVVQGDLFFALPADTGGRFNVTPAPGARDGHNFVVNALASGAAAVVVSQPLSVKQSDAMGGAVVIRVADTFDALWALGRAARERFRGAVVAVTGSSGKTTAKNFLCSALGAVATPGSFNNHIGVPLSLSVMPPGAKRVVIEIGTNHPGEIQPLAQMTRPDVAVVLNVQSAHLGNFGSVERIQAEKLSIAQGLDASGTLVLESSLPAPAAMAHNRVVRFGLDAQADVRLVDMQGDRARYTVFGVELSARVPGGGWHRAQTLGAVLAVAHVLGVDLGPALEMQDAVVPSGRGGAQTVSGVTVVDDSYNANPASMRAALRAFAARAAIGRRLVVLGEMAELGAYAASEHAALADDCAEFDTVFLVGEGTAPLREALPASVQVHNFSRADDVLLQKLSAELVSGDAVLVKGSNTVFWQQGFVSRLHELLATR